MLSIRQLSLLPLVLAGLAQAAVAEVPPTSTADHPLAHDALPDTWIDRVDVTRWPDHDGDGFASGLSVLVDADTLLSSTQRIFLRLSLTGSDGVERLLHDSSEQRLDGRGDADRVEVEFDLIDAFPTDRYDLVVELRDADRDTFLDVVDRTVLDGLGNLALEDAWRDGRLRDDPVHTGHDPHYYDHGYDDGYSVAYTVGYTSSGYDHGGSSYVAAEYAGAGGPLALLGLAGLALLRGRRG